MYEELSGKTITKQQFNNILRRMIKEDILERYSYNTGSKGRPGWVYTIKN